MAVELLELERYIKDVLGEVVHSKPWRGVERLPHFLRDQYEFAEVTLLGQRSLLVLDAASAERSPAAVHKQMDLIQAKEKAPVVYVRARITAYNRKRLIEHKVPFIVPGNQMYLPTLAIDLREHFRKLRLEIPTLSPSTHAVIIHAMLRKADVLTPIKIAQRLGYSAMTMTRVFNELEAARIGEVTPRGRERYLRFVGTPQEIWAKALPLLQSPVNKRIFIRRVETGLVRIRAGLTALAQYSMLAPPTNNTYAMSLADWKLLRRAHKLTTVPIREPDTDEIEIWAYAPALFADRDVVDPLSLSLSLKDDRDERVDACVAEMMRKFEW